ncbi:MAG: hypothetical protein LBQ54_07335 [Planctomycetaceae bacterium]|nr:hypothetical protein [Planctomycetaceae bacterium]
MLPRSRCSLGSVPLHRTSQAVGEILYRRRTERSEREQIACRGFPAAIQRVTLMFLFESPLSEMLYSSRKKYSVENGAVRQDGAFYGK